MAKLKTYCGVVYLGGNKSGSGFISATSRSSVVKILNELFYCSANFVKDYWSEVGNPEKYEFLNENKETLVVQYPSFLGEYMTYQEAKKKAMEDWEDQRKERIEWTEKTRESLIEKSQDI